MPPRRDPEHGISFSAAQRGPAPSVRPARHPCHGRPVRPGGLLCPAGALERPGQPDLLLGVASPRGLRHPAHAGGLPHPVLFRPAAGLAPVPGAGLRPAGSPPGVPAKMAHGPHPLHDRHPHGGLRLCRRIPAHASGQGSRRTGLRPVLALRRLCPGPAHQPHHGAGHGCGPARTDAPPAPARPFPGHEQGYRPCLPCPARRPPLAADRRPAGLRPGHRGHPHPAHAQRQCAQRPAKPVRRAADPDRPHGAGHGYGRGRPGLQFPVRGRGAFALHQYRRQPGVAASGKKAGRAPAARARPLAPPCSRGPAPAGARCRSFVQRLCPRATELFALAGAAGA